VVADRHPVCDRAAHGGLNVLAGYRKRDLSWMTGGVDVIVSSPAGGVITLESDGAALK